MLLPLSHYKKILFSENRGVFKVSALGEAIANSDSHEQGIDDKISYGETIKNSLESFRNFLKKVLKTFECDNSNYTKHMATTALRRQTTNRMIGGEKYLLEEKINEIKSKVE